MRRICCLALFLIALSGCKSFKGDKHSTTVFCLGFAAVHTRDVDIETTTEPRKRSLSIETNSMSLDANSDKSKQ